MFVDSILYVGFWFIVAVLLYVPELNPRSQLALVMISAERWRPLEDSKSDMC
jgi:hypothetical protein